MIATLPPLESWSSFYAMTGAAAASLVGLVFVVITLVQTGERKRSAIPTAVFTTPTVVHFGSVLVVAGILEAPWPAIWIVAILLGATALFGIGFTCLTAVRSRKLESYVPDLEDRIWHGFLPIVAYLTMLVGALTLDRVPVTALFAPAIAASLLLVIGIHNAWDIVTYVALDRD